MRCCPDFSLIVSSEPSRLFFLKARKSIPTFALLYIHTLLQPPKMRLKPEFLACKNWIFPLNRPRRDYQFNIAKNCLFHNTLVALPTGLGKTFIAGVVMLNCKKLFCQFWRPLNRLPSLQMVSYGKDHFCRSYETTCRSANNCLS